MTQVAWTAHEVFRRIGDGHDARETATYIAIQGNNEARWLLPMQGPGIAKVLASWTPYRLKSRLGWSTVRVASKAGWLTKIPGTSELEVECPCAANWESIGWRSLQAPIPVVYLGTPGPKRKAVVHLVEEATGACKAVAKIPLTDRAKTAVLREAAVLESLAEEGFEQAPRLLYIDSVNGIATQTFVEGTGGPRQMERRVWQLLRSLLLPGKTTSLSAHGGSWRQKLSECVEASSLKRVIDELRDDSSLPACWQHGDFAPWNIKRLPDGQCALVDWEEGRENAPPLQDAFHFLHMQDFLFRSKPALHAEEMLVEAREMGISARQCRKLEAAYLVDAFVRCTEQQNLQRRQFVSATLSQWQEQNA